MTVTFVNWGYPGPLLSWLFLTGSTLKVWQKERQIICRTESSSLWGNCQQQFFKDREQYIVISNQAYLKKTSQGYMMYVCMYVCKYVCMYVLGRCKSNCGFCTIEICLLILGYIPNRCGYVIYHFNVHFSLYVFLLMTLLAIQSFFFFDYRNDVRQKANWSSFFWVQNSLKIAETVCNINNAFDPGTANKGTVLWSFKKFCKRDESLEDGIVASHQKLITTSWKPSLNLIPL